jgi:DNA ligase (NAD+)
VPPSECPACAQPLTEQGHSRELFCTNTACPAQTVRRPIHQASRAAADIDAIGGVWIERLAESGDLEHPSDFYTLTKERLLEFDRIGEVPATRMIESIDAGRQVGLRRALVGPAIPMASGGTAARLCRAGFGSLEDVLDAGVDGLVAQAISCPRSGRRQGPRRRAVRRVPRSGSGQERSRRASW